MTVPPPKPHSDLFSNKHLAKDLKRRTVQGTALTAGAQVVVHLANLAALAVLGRVLTPQDFGLVAMVTGITGFAEIFRDLGLSQATIQREEITHEQTSYLFWVNVAVSLCLSLLLWLGSGFVADFYGEPRLELLTAVLGLSFLVTGFSVQHQALLRRHMRLGNVAMITGVSRIAGHVAAVVGALAGLGYWALALRALVTPAVAGLQLWAATGWLPGRPRRSADAGSLLSFGGYVTAFNVVNYIGRNIDYVLIGKFVGGEALGVYSRAYNLLMLPVRLVNRPVTAAAVPALSRIQGKEEQFADFYYRGVGLVALCSMPVVTSAAAVADSLVLTVLGAQWGEAAGLFRLLTVPAFLGTTSVVTGWAYMSLGNVRRQALSGFLNSLVGIVALSIGVRWGVRGVAWAMVISATLRRWPTIAYCYWGTPLTLRRLLSVLWRPAIASITAGGATYWLHEVLEPLTLRPLVLVACAPPFVVAYLAGLYLLPGGRQDIGGLVDVVKTLLGKRK